MDRSPCLWNGLRLLFFQRDPKTGVPDGLFSNQKSRFGKILEGLRLKIVDVFYGHWEYFKEIWDTL
jgi:hypothetical protein